VTASAYTAEYIALGRKVNSLLSGASPLKICMPRAVSRSTSTTANTTTGNATETNTAGTTRRVRTGKDKRTGNHGDDGEPGYSAGDNLETEWIGDANRQVLSLSSGDEENEVNGTRISTGSGKIVPRPQGKGLSKHTATRPVDNASCSSGGVNGVSGGRFKPPIKAASSSSSSTTSVYPEQRQQQQRSSYASIGSGKLSLKKGPSSASHASTGHERSGHTNSTSTSSCVIQAQGQGHVKKKEGGAKSSSHGVGFESIESFDSDFSYDEDGTFGHNDDGDFEVNEKTNKKRDIGEIITIDMRDGDDDGDGNGGGDGLRQHKMHRINEGVKQGAGNSGRSSTGGNAVAKERVLSTSDRLKLKEWLGHYRRRWGYYWYENVFVFSYFIFIDKSYIYYIWKRIIQYFTVILCTLLNECLISFASLLPFT
jgi:hypothetical protein